MKKTTENLYLCRDKLYKQIHELEDLKQDAEDYDTSDALEDAEGYIVYFVRLIEPDNLLAAELIQNSSSVECTIDRAELLSQFAAAVINRINAVLESQ